MKSILLVRNILYLSLLSTQWIQKKPQLLSCLIPVNSKKGNLNSGFKHRLYLPSSSPVHSVGLGEVYSLSQFMASTSAEGTQSQVWGKCFKNCYAWQLNIVCGPGLTCGLEKIILKHTRICLQCLKTHSTKYNKELFRQLVWYRNLCNGTWQWLQNETI